MRAAHIIVFVAGPLLVLWGFLIFRCPKMWAKRNARFSDKKFDSAKQLAAIRRFGIQLMILGTLSVLSVLATDALVPWK